jgi:hypothetical protein
MLIETRVLGKRGKPLDGWAVPALPGLDDRGGGGLTLRELITRIVRLEVDEFQKRERGRRLLRVLSDAEIADAAATGKIDSGGRPPGGSVDADVAVGAALQGFEDGLYLVILDGEEQRDLDKQVYVTAKSRLVFLRSTFLAGA